MGLRNPTSVRKQGSARLTGDVVLIEGTNVTLTQSGNTITINSSGGGSVSWGAITGTLSDQTDLQAALDAKAASSHTHLAADVTDFAAAVTSHADVSANTAKRHDAVTVTDSAEIDFTLVGQDITASIKAGSIDEAKLDASVNASLDLADSASQPGHTHTEANIIDLTHYNSSDFATDLATKDTDDLSEGSTNLYYTDVRADARITLQKAAANGLATLGADSKIPTAQLPALAISETSVVANETEQLALTAQEGDVAVRTDENKSYIHNGGTAGTMADWQELLTPTDTVLSVNSQTGTVVLTTTDIAEGSNLYYTEGRVSANTDVAANTAARHAAVTVTDSAEIDFTLTDQDITASLKASSIDESKLDASVNASLALADSASQPGHTHDISDDTNLAVGDGILLTDDTLSLDINGLTEESGIAAGDFLAFWDTTAGALKKVDYSDIGGGGGASTFLGLTDTPGAFTSKTLQLLSVNAGETAVEFSGVEVVEATDGGKFSAGSTSERDFEWTGGNTKFDANGSAITVHYPDEDGAVLLSRECSSRLYNKRVDPADNDIDGDHLDIDYTPTNYTPSTTPAEADDVDDLAAHLAGIDNELGGNAVYFAFSSGADSVTTGRWIGLGDAFSAYEDAGIIMPVAGTATKIVCKRFVTNGTSRFTIYKNASADTSLQADITSGNTDNTDTGSVSFAAGDVMSIHVDEAVSPISGVHWCTVIFTPT